jgi:formylglycine-generating enzyme required for sulfatase activity
VALLANLLALVAGLTCPLAWGFVYETEREIVGTGDFDGNGLTDVVIVDRASGKYRLGYQGSDGTFNWVNYRLSGVKDVTGMTAGRLFEAQKDALMFTAADANLVTLADAANPGATPKAEPITFESLGPSAIVAVDLGGAGNTPLDDVLVASIYNDPTPNKLTLLRNPDGKNYAVFAEASAKAQLVHANRIALVAGSRSCLAAITTGDAGDAFRLGDFSTGKEVILAEAAGLPKGSDYVLGNFGAAPLPVVIVYQHGEKTIQARSMQEAGGGKYQFGEPKSFDLAKPIKLLACVPKDKGAQLLAVFGKGESAEIYSFDGASAPVLVQAITPQQGDAVFGAVALANNFLVLLAPDYSKFSTHVQAYQFTGTTNAAGPLGKLASLADNDDWTLPDTHKRLVETLRKEGINTEADMRAYTNAVPGSSVNYVMVPIKGGEFVMGSPDGEKGRKPDESPQHKVKVGPFWIGQFEVTWNEYEIFMYPDDEKKMRETTPTDEDVNKLSDGVVRPSKPYTEMSFGMGREGFPAISMTQHAANKYCHWLSAKTGHCYRLPTEAEWEYACRAGTTTTYSFGDDPEKLGDYAWFEQNSEEDGNWKYHKVGKKKPNPWGLYDMHGNVWEWCLDQYEDSYQKFASALPQDPWNKSTKPYPHAVRGGSFDDAADRLRATARRGSDPSWKMRDPQLPKSIWWLTDAKFVGFRLVRPLALPPSDQIRPYWTSGVERE